MACASAALSSAASESRIIAAKTAPSWLDGLSVIARCSTAIFIEVSGARAVTTSWLHLATIGRTASTTASASARSEAESREASILSRIASRCDFARSRIVLDVSYSWPRIRIFLDTRSSQCLTVLMQPSSFFSSFCSSFSCFCMRLSSARRSFFLPCCFSCSFTARISPWYSLIFAWCFSCWSYSCLRSAASWKIISAVLSWSSSRLSSASPRFPAVPRTALRTTISSFARSRARMFAAPSR
mmetsp:Transcript_36243/g.107468  ORF Transcript_36243/g.107468 Transcript_36243/m.107468 type:complete len:242 (-) Transcript_36243:250-975(-)